MKIWKNTETLSGYDEGLVFTDTKEDAHIALLGSKSIELNEFPKLKGIFRAGIGKDNVPIAEAEKRQITVRFPSTDTVNIIFEETANFTCSLIFRMLYQNTGTIQPWKKIDRSPLQHQTLLIIGKGNIGKRVAQKMSLFINVITYDILENSPADLLSLIPKADCISLHIPNSPENIHFMDSEKLTLMKKGATLINTARGSIVSEEALFKAIESHHIKAAFDVFWKEPYTGNLAQFHPDRFYMTPHVASTCRDFLLGCRQDIDKMIGDLHND
ncbi:MAG: hydroxyacid dehydrogenase [Candidatus Margulisbacteria bacterium]|nr:hydroxyacid dehydrogenase [Candidatus Margulisiibacteriota bacterium]